MGRPRQLVPVCATTVLATVAIGGCGSSGPATGGRVTSGGDTTAGTVAVGGVGTGPAETADRDDRLSVAAPRDGALAYSEKEMFARAGTVRITFTNDSPLSHDLAVQRGTSGRVLGETPTFFDGSKTLSLRLSPARYTYFCTVPGHRAGGMFGTLVVRPRG